MPTEAPHTEAGRAHRRYLHAIVHGSNANGGYECGDYCSCADDILAIEAEAAATPQVQPDPPAEGLLREALANLVGMVEENGPDFADADAMVDARRALGVGIHDVVELAAQGYRFATTPAAKPEAGAGLIRLAQDVIDYSNDPRLVQQARLTLADTASPPARLDALRWLFEVVQRLDKQAQKPGPDHLVKITVETWRSTVAPAIRQVERALAETASPRSDAGSEE